VNPVSNTAFLPLIVRAVKRHVKISSHGHAAMPHHQREYWSRGFDHTNRVTQFALAIFPIFRMIALSTGENHGDRP